MLEQLQSLGQLISRRMFGGAGLYRDDVFFGLIYKERLYFRTDDTTRADYEARGGEPFRPRAKFTALKAAYYAVPADVLEDSEELVQWARKAVAAAVASQAAKAAIKKTRPGKKSHAKGGAGEGPRHRADGKVLGTRRGDQRRVDPHGGAGRVPAPHRAVTIAATHTGAKTKSTRAATKK